MATDAEISFTAERKTAETLDLTPAAPPSANPDRLKGSPGPAVVEASKKTEADAGPDSEIIAPVSDTEKKIRRAERFGITVQLSEEEKRNSRAERFGSGSSSHGTEASKKSEDLKRKARAERFGMVVPPSATDEEMKKKARLERFASTPKIDAQEEDKRKARALRFSQPQSSSVSINGKEDMKPKTAIAGEAAGGS